MTDLPIACSLNPAQLRAARAGLLPGLLQRAEATEAVEGGYRLRFVANGETLATITKVIDAERQCCRFLRFDLTVEPDGGPVWFTVTGPEGTQGFLADLLA